MTFGGTSSDCVGSGVMVVAHPDDETLWLQPQLADVDTVVVAFPSIPVMTPSPSRAAMFGIGSRPPPWSS